MNYSDAEETCANNGMRLCTKDELLSDICCGTGGSCDNYLIWTSTSSIDGIHECVENDDCSENSRVCIC